MKKFKLYSTTLSILIGVTDTPKVESDTDEGRLYLNCGL